MAILFCRAQVIKRSEGRSAVACAAYRCGMTLEDTRTGQTHDYSRKHGVIAQGILTPDHAPEWAKDPRQLWNRVEVAETRRDAQLARELVIALPHEVQGEHREYLIKNILRPLVRNGAVAHYMLHEPSPEGDERNVHAHVMLTMRRLEGQEFGHKAREWNDKAALQEVKKTIERETNRMLERLGHDQRVSVELADGQQPTRHLGPKATQLERQGLKTECGEENRRVQDENNRRQELERLKAQTEREIAQQEAERQRRTEEERRKAAEAGQEPPSPAASWWQASHARAAMHAPIPAPSNDNQQNTPEAPPKRREHVPRTPAARAFERAQQPEKAPQPESPRRRSEQRETFNKAAQPPSEPAKAQESRLDRILREREERQRQRRERQEEREQGQGRSLADEWQDRLRKGPR